MDLEIYLALLSTGMAEDKATSVTKTMVKAVEDGMTERVGLMRQIVKMSEDIKLIREEVAKLRVAMESGR